MQVNISKKHGRVVKLNKRERDLLAEAKRLCAELSTVTTHEVADAFSVAADQIQVGLETMDSLPLVAEQKE